MRFTTPAFLRAYTTRALDVLLGVDCVLCGARPVRPSGVCACCDEQHRALRNARLRCARCAIGLITHAADALCGDCRREAPPFDAAICGAEYVAPLDRLVRDLKFNRSFHCARPLAAWLAHAPPPIPHIDAIVPIPLSPQRLAARGYNQSRILAARLSRAWKIPLADAWLMRVVEHPPLASLAARERVEAIRGAFVALPACAGKAVALVDDVMTSGATMREAARVLKAAGASAVVACAALRTPMN
ncbi:MAG TPA: ComF family protein [Burkholderiaceae bacterium]|nr:ComF family protein [Burkholderiaceae bacterium]